MDNASGLELSTAATDPTAYGSVVRRPDFGVIITAILNIIFYTSVMLLGISGNSLILRVYGSKPQKTSTHVLIRGLAWFDLMACALRIHNIAYHVAALLGRQLPIFFIATTLASTITPYTSVVLTGAIAVERYDCVCRPRRRLLNPRRAKLLVLGSCLGAVAGCIPYAVAKIFPSPTTIKTALEFQLIPYVAVLLVIAVCYGRVYQTIRKHLKISALSSQGLRTNRSADANTTTRRGNNSIGTSINTLAAQISTDTERVSGRLQPSSSSNTLVVAVVAGPSTSTTPTDAAGDLQPIGRDGEHQPAILQPQPAKGISNDPTVSLQRKTTRMLFVTSVVFLITWLPYWLYVAVALHKYNGADIDDNVLVVVYHCASVLHINNVVNPLIYGVSNRRFRKDSLDMLRKLKPC
ncbi:gastrin/cholecystokinin type B receptor-like [Acanthaster planci]|uniref:Gastrin/cholecystokinin type B receptor-like n=1 Tax=Acanthaster planci TaxID=133434 RepID=A0A8B7YZQ7_ACAPL|nr:gastrin/cholecystokinin type B receptor-like [Acanthaster planci]